MSTQLPPHKDITIVIAGANGFVGRALTKQLSRQCHIIALTRRSPSNQETTPNVEWRQCDLFSLLDAEKAMAGANYAIYLVHSMLPSARLTQGSFQDLDLILADNFARAAEAKDIKHIVYLGGIIPETQDLSAHLASRLEVEEVLSSRSVPLTALRTSIIVGPNGSSFDMMQRLVSRLPVMVCPKWTQSKTQPVALETVVAAFEVCLGNPRFYNRHLDIAGPDIMTYQEMMQTTAKCLHKKRWIFTVPVFSPRLSVLWVCLFSQMPSQLVAPLVESLRHDMVATSDPLVSEMALPNSSFCDSVKNALQIEAQQAKSTTDTSEKSPTAENKVRSVQRLPLPLGKTALWVAKKYPDWLAGSLSTFLRVNKDADGSFEFRLRFCGKALLQLTFSQSRSQSDRQLFYITGGLLAKNSNRSRLEFRQVLRDKYVLATIHDYEPSLPWYIYTISQSLIHLWIMYLFGKYLQDFDGNGCKFPKSLSRG